MFTPGSRGCGYKTVSGRHEWLNRDPIAEWGGLNLYAYVANNPINLFDPLGLVDCATLASLIANQENNIHGAIRSMSDINQMFNSAENMQIAALGGEIAYGATGVGFVIRDFVAEHAAAQVFSGPGGNTSAAMATAIMYAGEEGGLQMANQIPQAVSGVNLLNLTHTAAEQDEAIAENMSSSTYQTIQGLQSQLAGMLNLYNSNCKCKQ
jgi:uncharacterized protein RhaS with RHS repeats